MTRRQTEQRLNDTTNLLFLCLAASGGQIVVKDTTAANVGSQAAHLAVAVQSTETPGESVVMLMDMRPRGTAYEPPAEIVTPAVSLVHLTDEDIDGVI